MGKQRVRTRLPEHRGTWKHALSIGAVLLAIAVAFVFTKATADTQPATDARQVSPRESVRVLPNGAAITTSEDELFLSPDGNWAKTLLNAYPQAATISLRGADGLEVASAARTCGDDDASCATMAKRGDCLSNASYMHVSCAFSCRTCADRDDEITIRGELPHGKQTLHAVVDDFAFVWSPTPVERNVVVGFDGESVKLKTLSQAPRVFEVEAIASAEECAAIARLAKPVMTESIAHDGPGSNTTTADDPAWDSKPAAARLRNSASGWLDLSLEKALTGDAARLQEVWLRIAALARVDPRSAEPMQAIRYRKGEHYWYHVDAGGSTGALVGRALTVLLYLSDGFTGGETSFALAGEPAGMGSKEEVYAALGTGCTTKRGLTITPKAGNALLFYNLQPNSARVDSQSWHASCDVQSGEKLAANLWFHLGLEEFLSTGRKPFSRRPGASIFGAGFLDDDTAFRNYQLG